MKAPINVLYIAGSGRSGSTLLDRVLGQAPEMTSLGEMRYLWSFGLLDNNLCECGSPFRQCPFWSDVVRASLGAPERDELERASRIARRLDRTPAIPRLLGWLPRASRRPAAEVEAHVEALARVYRAISERAGTPWLVDSSKAPAYGFLIARIPGIHLHVLHLVRDSRAVCHSWQRKRRRPEVTAGTVYMPQRPALVTALRWDYGNLLDEALGRVADGYQRLRYEDFVASPVQSVNRIRAALGLPGDATGGFLTDRAVDMSPSHTVAGNPGRFATGMIRFRLDDGWRSELSSAKFALVTLVTLPQLLYYGYGLSRRT